MCVCVCVCFGYMNALLLRWEMFWELNMLSGFLVKLLACCIYLFVFFPLEILIFFKLDIFLTDPQQFPFLSSFLSLASIETSTNLLSIKEFSCALCLLDRISTDLQSINISGLLLDRSSTVSWSNENFRFHLHKSSTTSLIHRAKFLCSLFAR